MPQFGFVLQVDIPAPAEQDERDVERQRRARDAEFGAEIASEAKLVEEGAAVPDQQHDGGDQDREHQRVTVRIRQPRVRRRRQPGLFYAKHLTVVNVATIKKLSSEVERVASELGATSLCSDRWLRQSPRIGCR